MPTFRIQNAELSYDESSVITIDEGLIGLPHLRRMALVRQTTVEPFLWLASLDDEKVAFLVVDPRAIFSDYEPRLTKEMRERLALADGEPALALAIVLIAPEWTKTTINLRAPILINPRTMRGAQMILSETPYRHDELLPQALLAA